MYYNKEIKDIYKELNSSKDGLNNEDVKKRLLEFGKNKLVEKNNLSNEVINKIKGKFSIENAGDIKDIMVSQSSARKKVNNSG